MAKSLGERKIKVTASTKGVTGATKQVKGLGKATTATAKEQNIAKRKQESLHKETINTSKAFSKQQQGLGGLVRAYATIAANIFALTAAYGLLRRAADFQSMLKSTDNLESRMGTSVSNIAKEMQKASGHALDFRQSIESTNRALSAGFNQTQISELTDVVARASQTFGGSVDANMNKAINAVLRGRTETLATMGIVIDLNRAYTDYAATLGKTSGELSKYHQQQAVINALLKEGQQNLDGIALDPNPFMKLANTLFDTAQDVTTAVVRITEPLISLVNTSKEFAGMIIATLAAVFVSKLTPDASGYFEAASRAAKQSSVNISKAASLKIKAERTFHKESKVLIEQARESKRREFIAFVQAERDKVQDVSKSSKTMQALFKELETAGKDAFINIEGEQRRALGTMQGNLTRYINDTSDKSVMPAVKNLGSVEEAKRIRNAADSLAGENRKLDRDIQKTTANMGKLRAAWTNVGNQAKLTTNSMTRSFAMQRRSTHSLISQYGLLTGTMRAWRLVLIGAEHDTLRYVKANGFLGRSFKVLAVSIRGAAFAMTLFARALNALPWLIGIITTLMFAWKWIADKLGIGKVSKNMEEFNEALEKSNEALAKHTRRLVDYAKVAERATKTGFVGIAQKAEFLSNALQETMNPVEDMVDAFSALGLTKEGKPVADRLVEIRRELGNMNKQANESTGVFNRLSRAMQNFLISREILATEASIKTIPDGPDAERLRAAGQARINQLREARDGPGFEIKDEVSTYAQQGIDRAAQAPKLMETALKAMFSQSSLLDNDSPEIGAKIIIDKFMEGFERSDMATDFRSFFGHRIKVALEESIKEQNPKAFADAVSSIFTELGSTDAYKVHTYADVFERLARFMGELPRAAQLGLAGVAAANKEAAQLSSTISGLRAAKGNLFFDKAGLGDEVKAIRDMQGILSGIEDSPLFQQESLSQIFADPNLKSFFQLTGAEDLEQTIAKVKGQLDAFRAYAADKVLTPLKLEELKAEKDLRQIEKSRTVNLDNIYQITLRQSQIDKENLTLNIRSNEYEMKALQLLIYKVGVGSEQGRLYAAQIGALRAQTEVLRAQKDMINERLDAELAVNNAIISRQGSELASLNNQIGAMQQLLAISGDMNKIYAEQAKIFESRGKAIQLQASTMGLETDNIQKNITAGQFKPEDLNKLIQMEGQIVQLMAQQIALNREEQRTNLRNLARSGEEGNFQAKQQSFMLEFVQAGEELARNMVDSGARVAQHFNTVIQSTFGMIVDKLLDGSRDFLEAFKDILRDTLGEFIKTNINNAMTFLMADLMKGKLGEEDPALMANTTSLQTLNGSVMTLVAQMQAEAARKVGITHATSFSVPDTSPQLNGILNNTGKTAAVDMANEVASALDPVHAAEYAIASTTSAAVTSIAAQMPAILGFLQAMAAGSASDTGNNLVGMLATTGTTVAAAADGAVFKGMKRYANGGIVRQPELALIGEGRNHEAVIPMPNNREVPVQLLGNEGGDSYEINNTYDFRNADPRTEASLRTQAETIKRDTFNKVFSEINKGGKYAKMSGRR